MKAELSNSQTEVLGKVIVVDDHLDHAQGLNSILNDNHFNSQIVKNDDLTLEKIKQTQPDVIIINNVEVLKVNRNSIINRINCEYAATPIPILFTCDNNEPELKIGFDLTCSDYISLPLQSVEVVARVTTYVEISKKRKQLNKKNNQLSAVTKELESFAYSISHDLRAPLRSIFGFSSIIREDYSHILDEEGKNYLSKVENGVLCMRDLIDDILQLSKLSQKKLSREHVDLSSLVKNACKALSKEKKLQQLDWKISENIICSCDKEMIRLLLSHLLDNACKFTSIKDNASIEFGTKKRDNGDAFFIKDNGIGFDMDYAHKLYQPFQKLHQSNEFSGRGIGLSAVQKIINIHGGKIWAESEIDKGATFYFTLE